METKVYIQNLKCNGCANTIVNKLSVLQNISDVTVNIEETSVSFSYTDELSYENAVEQLKIMGYPEQGNENTFTTKAKSYLSCAVGKMA